MQDKILKTNLIPDWVLKIIIHRLNQKRLVMEDLGSLEKNQEKFMNLIHDLKNSPIALTPHLANEQHYELPYEYFDLVLGKHKKYSCCYYYGNESLDEAEENMLKLYIDRAELKDGQSILDLGCGWGSLSLYLAEKFPKSKIVAVSNSNLQRKYIENQIKKRNLKNLTVITKDMNEFTIKQKFHRVISIEMFEHMRNYKLLMKKIASFLRDDGKLFVHIFVHKQFSYYYEVKDETDWMAKYFFTNGIMPSVNLLHYFQEDLKLEKEWHVDGIHYFKTSRDWLKNHLKHKDKIIEIFKNVYEDPELWYIRWKIFFLAVAEFFKTNHGREWFVAHYLFKK